jgi:hypothetical protein
MEEPLVLLLIQEMVLPIQSQYMKDSQFLMPLKRTLSLVELSQATWLIFLLVMVSLNKEVNQLGLKLLDLLKKKSAMLL